MFSNRLVHLLLLLLPTLNTAFQQDMALLGVVWARGGSVISERNGASGSCSTGTTCAVTLPSTLSGSAILCVFVGDASPTVTVADNKSQSYTDDYDLATLNGNSVRMAFFSFLNSAS